MYTLGVPNRQYRRATQVLGPESADPIDYDMVKQDDGFYLFSFPDVDEYDFRDIVMLLKSNGVTTIGADDILTERNIMKLTDLLKEESDQLDRWKTDQDRIKKRYAYTQGTPSPDENNIIDQLEVALKRWEEDKTPPYDRLDSCERSDQYHEDIKDIVDSFKNPLPSPGEEDRIEKDDEDLANAKTDLDTMQEQGLTEAKKFDIDKLMQGAKEFFPRGWNSRSFKEKQLAVTLFKRQLSKKDQEKYFQEQGLNRMNRDMTPEEEYLKDNPSPGTSSPMVPGDGNTLKIKPKEGDIQSEVTIKQQACSGNLEKCLEDVTISWDSEGPFKLDFEYDDTVSGAHAYDETDVAEYVAKSDDEYYQFILDVDIVSPKFSGDGGAIEVIDWETLRIEVDPRFDDAIRSDFDDPVMEEGMMCEMCGEVHEGSCSLQEALTKRQLQIRAGIIK